MSLFLFNFRESLLNVRSYSENSCSSLVKKSIGKHMRLSTLGLDLITC